jgi:hypothetical protein
MIYFGYQPDYKLNYDNIDWYQVHMSFLYNNRNFQLSFNKGCRYGNINIVSALIHHPHIDLNNKFLGMNSLELALHYKHSQIAEMLINYKPVCKLDTYINKFENSVREIINSHEINEISNRILKNIGVSNNTEHVNQLTLSHSPTPTDLDLEHTINLLLVYVENKLNDILTCCEKLYIKNAFGNTIKSAIVELHKCSTKNNIKFIAEVIILIIVTLMETNSIICDINHYIAIKTIVN